MTHWTKRPKAQSPNLVKGDIVNIEGCIKAKIYAGIKYMYIDCVEGSYYRGICYYSSYGKAPGWHRVFINDINNKIPITGSKRSELLSNLKNDQISSHVYVIHAVGTDYFKIGLSKTPVKRLVTLQPLLPFELNIVHECQGSFAMESKIHDIFSKKRIRGEWFKLNDQDLLVLKNYLTK